MSLQPGSRLGPYEIAAHIGAGGMGEVYRATDTNLKRAVAIKVLPESVATDPERLARFQREAEVLAALNHPNIAQIYGLERLRVSSAAPGGHPESSTALVMELVDGPTLADVIERRHPKAASVRAGGAPVTPETERVSARSRDVEGSGIRRGDGAPRGLNLDDALAIARQIADALEAAHEQGIVHRDLKPANVKVRDDGTVKVLDFGLAKAMDPAGGAGATASASMSPTITSPAMTQMGMILGTAAYMAPEQARGRTVDTRADIWAFGCVLFEMLAGRRAFDGEDITEILGAVVRLEPAWEALPSDLPARIRQTLRGCLQKDPKRRIAHIHDVGLALEGAFDAPESPAPVVVLAAQPVWRQAVPVAIGASAAVALAAALVAWTFWPTARPGTPTRFLHELPAGQEFRRSGRPVMALSRDGRTFVYNTAQGLYLRSMDAETARLIPGTEIDLANPFLSPDGQSAGYFDNTAGQLRRISVTGGVSVLIAAAANPYGVSWEADDTILFGQAEGILRVPAAGGTPELVIKAAAGERMHGPQQLPGGDSVLFCVTTGRWDEAKVVVESLSTHERTVLVNGGCDARYVPTGHLVYALEDGLFAQAFAPDRRTVSGAAVPLLQGLMRAGEITGAANYSVSEDGTLVYVSGESGTLKVPVWVDLQGKEDLLGVEPQTYEYLRLSPDRARLALVVDIDDVFVWDMPRKVLTNVTASATAESEALWNHDGTRLIFSSDRDGRRRLYSQAADGTGTPEPLTRGDQAPAVRLYPQALSPDGAWLVYQEIGGTGGSDLRVLSLTGDRASEDLVSAEFEERNADVSPNGRWLAYESNREGQANIYVSPFPGAAARQWKISPAGGAKPAWAPDGRRLFYVVGGARLMAADVDPDQPAFVFDTPEDVLDVSGYWLTSSNRTYEVDTGRFLFLKGALAASGADVRRQIHIVQHWTEELKRRVPID